MSLQDAVNTHGLSNDDESIRAWLGETVEFRRDATPYTWSGLAKRMSDLGFPVEVVMGLAQYIAALPGGDMLDRMLSSGGVNFTLPEVRLALEVVQAQAPEPVKTVVGYLLWVGIQTTNRFQLYGMDELPTLEQIGIARTSLVEAARLNTFLNEVINPAVAQNKTVDEMKDIVAAWEG